MLDDAIDGFLFGFFNEAAGIDDDHLRFSGVAGQLESAGYKSPQHDFGVDLVLRTTEVDESDGRFGGGPAWLDERGRHTTSSLRDAGKACQTSALAIPRRPVLDSIA